MINLQKLLGKEDRFFEMFEASAEECRHCVRALKEFLQAPEQAVSMEAFVSARRRDKRIHTEISRAVCSAVVTSLDREDIMSLANALYKIPKTVEKIGERILLAPSLIGDCSLANQIAMVEQATQTLYTIIQALRKGQPLETIQEHNDKLQRIEGDADKLVLELLRGLYTSEMPGRRIVFLKDLFELLEKITDRCRDAGNVVVQIVLKNT